jgi:iron complex outermembrane receptor protein
VALGFNLGVKPTFRSGLDKKIADASVSHDIGSKLTIKADFLYAETATASVLNPQPVTASIASLVGDPGVPITDTSGLTIRNRFISGPNRIYTTSNDFYRGTVDLIGNVNEYFNFDAYVNYNDARQTNLNFNQILNSALVAGIASGNINLFAITQSPAGLAAANIYGTAVGIFESKLISYDMIAHGKILDIWSGEISYAAGVEFRKETLSATADYNSLIQPNGSSLWNNGTTINPFSQGYTVESQFGEIKVPITSPQNAIPGLYLLTADAAVRHEIYSGGTTVTVPKFSIRYLPLNEDFGFRATTGQSFQTPTLYDLYGPSSSGFSNSPGSLNVYNSAGVATGAKFPNLQTFESSGSNSSLAPQRAKNYTIGGIYSPRYVKGLELTIDYYNIKQTNVIDTPASDLTMLQSVEQYGTASPFAPYVTIGNFANQGGHQVTGPGQVSSNLVNIYVLESLVNIGTINQSGFDLHAKYRLPWEKYGQFTVETSWANLRTFFIKLGPSDPGTDYAGYADDGTMPHWRSYSTVDWTYKGYGATLGYTHLPKVPDMEGGFESAYNVIDLQTRFDMGELVNPALAGLSVDLGCNNLNNQHPPLDANVFNNPPFDGSAYSPFGRVWYVDLKYKF